MSKKQPTLLLYTDGSSLGNPGPGGWAAVLIDTDTQHRTAHTGGTTHATNNQMELTAAIEGLTAITDPTPPVSIVTDSKYLYDGITSYIHKRKRTNRRTASKQPVKNQDLWLRLDEQCQRFAQLSRSHTYAHADDEINNDVDQLARNEAMKYA